MVLTMAEYIRKEDAIKCIEGQCVDGKMWGNDESEGTLIEAYSAIDDLMEIPPADVAPVVRCKNCKFSHADGHGRTCEGYWFELSEYAVSVKDDAFCSYGERRDKP